LDAAIDAAIQTFDFQAEVQRLLRPEIQRFVEQAVKAAMGDVLYDAKLRDECERAVRGRIAHFVDQWAK
jgi:hypothetical protein